MFVFASDAYLKPEELRAAADLDGDFDERDAADFVIVFRACW